jgi:drug/metabolite transporter (DMT)-like permease
MGQILLKQGVIASGEVTLKISLIGELVKLVFTPTILGGFLIYFLSSILWLIALSKTTLNFAYPFTAVTLALVMLSSRLIFLENIPTLRYIGISLIIIGVLFCSAARS